jgi:hypothetical protein
MHEAIPFFIRLRIGQPEVGAEIDNPATGVYKRRHHFMRLSVGITYERHVGVLRHPR